MVFRAKSNNVGKLLAGMASHVQVSGMKPFRSTERTAMKFHGNVRGEVRVNFWLFTSKPRICMCGVLKLFRIVRANVRLNFCHSKSLLVPEPCLISCLLQACDRPGTSCLEIGKHTGKVYPLMSQSQHVVSATPPSTATPHQCALPTHISREEKTDRVG